MWTPAASMRRLRRTEDWQVTRASNDSNRAACSMRSWQQLSVSGRRHANPEATRPRGLGLRNGLSCPCPATGTCVPAEARDHRPPRRPVHRQDR